MEDPDTFFVQAHQRHHHMPEEPSSSLPQPHQLVLSHELPTDPTTAHLTLATVHRCLHRSDTFADPDPNTSPQPPPISGSTGIAAAPSAFRNGSQYAAAPVLPAEANAATPSRKAVLPTVDQAIASTSSSLYRLPARPYRLTVRAARHTPQPRPKPRSRPCGHSSTSYLAQSTCCPSSSQYQ